MSRHRPNPGLYREQGHVPVVLDASYQAEVDRTLGRAEKKWREATAALAKAKKRAERHAADLDARDALRQAEAAVSARLAELRDVQRLMQQPVRGNNWSGVGSVRFTPKGHRGL